MNKVEFLSASGLQYSICKDLYLNECRVMLPCQPTILYKTELITEKTKRRTRNAERGTQNTER